MKLLKYYFIPLIMEIKLLVTAELFFPPYKNAPSVQHMYLTLIYTVFNSFQFISHVYRSVFIHMNIFFK